MGLFRSMRRDVEEVRAPEGILNTRLYVSMVKRFGRVTVINPGEEMCGAYGSDAQGRSTLTVYSRGETYVTCCPFCGDSRDRLYVSHFFGVRDQNTNRRHREMWKCFNAECQEDFDNRLQLEEDLINGFEHFPAVKIGVTQTGPKGLEPCTFPGTTVSIDALEPDHPAAAYLDGRNFDRTELARTWGVMLATHVPPRIRGSAAQGRIILPVRVNGSMVGWQARYAGDLEWKKAAVVKYLTYFPKSLAVYGIDEAAGSRYVALMEGATDVWRHGPGAVCPLGKTFSPTQVKITAERAAGRPVVLVPDRNDPDSEREFIKTATKIVREQNDNGWNKSAIGMVMLPDGADPGKLDRDVLQSLCLEAATNPAWRP